MEPHTCCSAAFHGEQAEKSDYAVVIVVSRSVDDAFKADTVMGIVDDYRYVLALADGFTSALYEYGRKCISGHFVGHSVFIGYSQSNK